MFERVALAFERDESADERLSKLEGFLVQYGFSPDEALPLLASLLSVPLNERYAPLSLTPERQKQKTLDTLLAVLLEWAVQQPVLFVVEDLHWADPSTLELLDLIIDQGPTARILVVLSFRPNFSPPWTNRSHLTQITLSHLTPQQGEAMVKKITGETALPDEVLEKVVERTDGVPLFVEELTRMVLESDLLDKRGSHYKLKGSPRSLSGAIPTTLADSLMARLDRLNTAKEVAQLGATIGREFSYELLFAVSMLDSKTLQRELERLVEIELLYQRGIPPQAIYLFKHALIQDTAYQSLLKSTRQRYHQQMAQVLAERFPGTAETQPELLAHHYTEAGLGEEAIAYWQRASERAIERSANIEAMSHLRQGLELIQTLPQTPERDQQELDLQITLGPVLMAVKGYAAPDVEQTYARARELCQNAGETPQRFQVLLGLWNFYCVRAEFEVAQELGQQLLALAQELQKPDFLMEAHAALGETLMNSVEFTAALSHFEDAIALYAPQRHRSHAILYGQDVGVTCLGYLSWILWYLGYPDQALKRSYESLALARQLDHPFTLVFALGHAAQLHQFRREAQATQEKAAEAIALATKHGFSSYLTIGAIYQGGALLEQGQQERGFAQLRHAIAAWQGTGAEIAGPNFLAMLAKTYWKLGQTKEGLAALDEGLALVDKFGSHHHETELYRLKGELLLMQGGDTASPACIAEAEVCLSRALKIARRQHAKSFELQAAVSLSRLWQKIGKTKDALSLLAEVYGWFTEGFDTLDLKEAKALLNEWSILES